MVNLKKMKILTRTAGIVLLVAIVLGGCENTVQLPVQVDEGHQTDDEHRADDGQQGSTRQIGTSTVQKGPFVSGSPVFVQTLDSNLDPTGQVFVTQTSNDLGEFRLGSAIETDVVEVIAIGFYFDGVANKVSDTPLTLRSVVDLSVSDTANVNILTTLTRDRIVHLVTEEGRDFNEAKHQAEQEILAALNIPWSDEYAGFESMDISTSTERDGLLLAISAVLQADNSVGELSELISKINNDFRTNGELDVQSTVETLGDQALYIFNNPLAKVRTNLSQRYDSIGLSVTVPEFEQFWFPVKYRGNGNSTGDPPESIVVFLGQTVTISDNENMRGPETQDGITRTFRGWNTAADGNGTSYSAGDTIDMPFGGITLYAQWGDLIGGIGPAGGWIFYIDEDNDFDWTYLEAAPESTEWSAKKWGKNGTAVNGTGTAIGTGKNNTALIVQKLNEAPADSNRAAQLADALSHGGFQDWFLPSIDELSLMFVNLKTQSVGGFADLPYWSSSSGLDARFNAWHQDFGNGDRVSNRAKDNDFHVRAIRAF